MGSSAGVASGITDVVDLSTIGSVGILTLAVLGVLFGLIYPKSAMKRAWEALDIKDNDNKQLRDILDKQAGLMEKMVDQLGDMKVTAQATLYAMQEIQVAGRHAAGMEPIARTDMQKQSDVAGSS